MVRCFLTGVQFPIEEAFVLNRREAHDLLDVLKDRVASLRRVIDQLSPLDDEDSNAGPAHFARPGFVRKKHRLVSKAVADALAPGCPEIRLFLDWPAYRSQARIAIRVHANPPRQPAASALSDDENKQFP